MKDKNTLWLCMKYSASCKLCPRNKKCDEEILKESQNKKVIKIKSKTKKVR